MNIVQKKLSEKTDFDLNRHLMAALKLDGVLANRATSLFLVAIACAVASRTDSIRSSKQRIQVLKKLTPSAGLICLEALMLHADRCNDLDLLRQSLKLYKKTDLSATTTA